MITDYGRDLWGQGDCDPAMPEAVGEVALKQNLLRRITTRRGTLPGSLDKGIDVRDFLHEGLTDAAILGIAARVRREVLDDERIAAATVTGEWNARTRTLALTIAAEGARGPFTLTLAVSAVTVELLRG